MMVYRGTNNVINVRQVILISLLWPATLPAMIIEYFTSWFASRPNGVTVATIDLKSIA